MCWTGTPKMFFQCQSAAPVQYNNYTVSTFPLFNFSCIFVFFRARTFGVTPKVCFVVNSSNGSCYHREIEHKSLMPDISPLPICGVGYALYDTRIIGCLTLCAAHDSKPDNIVFQKEIKQLNNK